jgi:hypothetical protein
MFSVALQVFISAHSLTYPKKTSSVVSVTGERVRTENVRFVQLTTRNVDFLEYVD